MIQYRILIQQCRLSACTVFVYCCIVADRHCWISGFVPPKKREPCHVDRAHATRHLFMACRGRYIPLQFLTLMLLSFILFVVFLSCTLVAPKYTKRPAQSKNSRNVLLFVPRCEHSAEHCLSLKPIRFCSGAPGLVRFSVVEKYNATAL